MQSCKICHLEYISKGGNTEINSKLLGFNQIAKTLKLEIQKGQV